MAVARLVAAPSPLPAAARRSPSALRLAFAPLPARWVTWVVPSRVASDDRAGAVVGEPEPDEAARRAVAERAARKQSERRTYLVAAVMSSLGITSMAAAAVYYRFAWQMEGGEIPVTEMFGTFALSVGAAVSKAHSPAHRTTPLVARWIRIPACACNRVGFARRSGWSSGRGGRTGRCGTRRCGTCTSRTTARATGRSSSTTSSPSSTPSRPCPSSPAVSSTAASSLASASARVSGSRCSGWRTCSSTTAWSTAASRWGPSPTCPTSGGSPPPTRYITWTSSRACHMGCSLVPRSWRRWVGVRSWRRRSREGLRGKRP